jgi:hypothetical protein
MNKAIRFTITTTLIDLIIAGLMFSLIAGGFDELLVFIFDFALNFVVGIAFLIIASYYFGKKMHILICQKKWNSLLIGILGMISILIIGIIGGSTVGFIDYGLESTDSISELIVDYYFKPLALILVYGGIPTIISGGILGVLIARITCYNTVY